MFSRLQIRFRIGLIICSSLYGSFLFQLFWKKSILLSALLFCILFVGLIFWALDTRHIKKRWIWGSLVMLGGIIWPLIPEANWQIFTAFILSLLSIGILLWVLGAYFSNIRKIVWIHYFSSWGYLFTLLTTILFGFALLGLNNKFPFQCEQIANWSQKLITTSTHPLHLGSQLLSRHDEKQVNTHSSESSANISEEWEFQKTIGNIWSQLKGNLWTGLIDTQRTINQQVCSIIIKQLSKVYQNPLFQIGAIFAMYLLFYGVIRLLVWMITLVGYLLFWLIKWCGVYRTQQVLVSVEELQ